MEIKTKYLEVKKTARYVSYGNLGPKTKYFWVLLHGSNMLCEQMIYKFSDFDPDTHFIVAPESLNRFYSKGFTGDILATWMTSRDRLKEIADFSFYLSKLYKKFTSQLPDDCCKIVLGFSQGGTTAFRWLHHHSIALDFLIGYSCWIPEDIDLRQSKTNLAQLKLLYTYGTQDQFLTQDRIEAVQEIIDKNKLKIKLLEYEGDHRVSKTQLKWLFENRINHKRSTIL